MVDGYSYLDIETIRAKRSHEYIDEARVVERVVSALRAGVDCELVGVHGTGKTDGTIEAAYRMNGNLFAYTFSAQTTIWDLVEEHTMRDGNSVMQGKVITDWITTEATKDKPAILMLDEIPKAYQTVIGFLHELTDSRGSLYLSGSNKRLYRSPNHHVVTTYNPMDKGNYVGFNLDPAFRDRFATIRVDYLSRPQEQRVLMAEAGTKLPAIPTPRASAKLDGKVDMRFVSNLTAFAQLVRSAYKKGDLSNTITTRGLITAVRLVKNAGWEGNDAVSALVEKFHENEIPIVRNMWGDATKEDRVRKATTGADEDEDGN